MTFLKKEGADQIVIDQRKNAFIDAQATAEAEFVKKRDQLLEAQRTEVKVANDSISGATDKLNAGLENFQKRQEFNEKGPLGT